MSEASDSRLIGSLLALLAHDLRNPLSALHSNVGFLESLTNSEDRDAHEALVDVMASCSSLKHIIDNLELLAFFVQGRGPELERTPLLLWDVVDEVLARVRGIADSYGVTVEVGEPGKSVRVVAHREMLVRAIGNLLFNSIQHGGSSAPVTVDISQDQDSGVILCSDGGASLADAFRAEAFTGEGQLTTKSEAYGRYSRGLGLFSARIAAELAGARVCALGSESGLNRFELRAPLA